MVPKSLLLALLPIGCAHAQEPLPMAKAPAGFWEHWGDGQAELNGYTFTQPRYGQSRDGEAILVFVTETFTHKQRVKSDGGHPDEYPVIKLNDVRDFQTGIYDYNAMTSAFVRLDSKDPIGHPTKISFSMQEWCGHVWDQWTIDGEHWTRIGHSYFDGEAETSASGTLGPRTLFADALPLYVRGLAGEWLAPGASGSYTLIPRAMQTRMSHSPSTPLQVTVHRSDSNRSVSVPAGSFDAEVWTISHDNKPYLTFSVEKSPPHRILSWAGVDGNTAALTGTTRLKYWQKAREGDEVLRTQLGLPVPTKTQKSGAQ